PQDRQSARPHPPAIAAAAGGSGHRMSRRAFVTGLGAVLAAPLGGEAQRTGKVFTIGILSSAAGPSPTYGPVLFNTLRDLGYEVGRNLVVEPRYASGRVDLLPTLATELIERPVEVIVALGPSESLAAAKATTTTPIVFISPAPVELGLVRSLARPGGNVTGLSADVTADIIGKQLDLLKTMVPNLRRLTVLGDPDRPDSRVYERALKEATQILRVEARMVAIRRERDFDAAFAEIAASRPDALAVRPEPLNLLYVQRITDFAMAQRLPTMSYLTPLVDAGGLMSYGPSLGDLFGRIAIYIDKILKGAKPADLPVEQPTRFALVVNLKTAKALGLTVPPSLLLRADQVIE